MADKITITLGTSNPHKVFEINKIAKPFDIEFLPLKSENFNPNENGETFEENAKIKAMEAAKVSNCGNYFMADDSGLCVDFLNGAPGIHSARYAETPDKRIEKLLLNLKEDKKRCAHFVCALCLVDNKGNILHTENGIVKGKIAHSKKGTNGFGYDPVFIVDGINKTMAELSEDEKNTLSHRGKALFSMIKWIKSNLN